MLRICKISGEELPPISPENVRDIRDLKHELCNLHGFPTCLQQLLHKGKRLDDSTKIDSLKDGNSSLITFLAQPDVLDAPIHLQIVLATASTAEELRETTKMFRAACARGQLQVM